MNGCKAEASLRGRSLISIGKDRKASGEEQAVGCRRE
jgi:hypothetical protein